MRYLKLFKESKDEYYTKLNYSQFINESAWHIDFSIQSIDYLIIFLINKNIEVNTEDTVMRIYYAENGIHKLIINIYELPDEYFIVDVGKSTYQYAKPTEYYKCDQIDGVKELLIDKGIIKE